ncbi:hypothetical protein Ctob_015120 [Chrysochromulina tobinii]|uniref:Uncharacterized protein n=1 Tax=Chrysochromulina tobinii TaxID=1460289 RepID=A0A0M0KBD4_9EUKA|nr:hypothetical protein Ctob_015120 [Chrysochromulina tobinii]|eukprot:KOO35902.1 hypothetical protein Ctob_015120 [Chrysochromulina sp. CCMP291]
MSAECLQSVTGPFLVISADVFQHLAPLRNPPGSRPGDVLSVVVLTDEILVSVVHEPTPESTIRVLTSVATVCVDPGEGIREHGRVLRRAVVMYLPLVRGLPTPARPDPPLMPQMVPFQADAASPLWAHLESLGLLGNYVAFSAQTAAARSAAEAAACERGARKRCREEEE